MGTQYGDTLQMWKAWAAQQRTLVPRIILLSDGADRQRLEWPPCHLLQN